MKGSGKEISDTATANGNILVASNMKVRFIFLWVINFVVLIPRAARMLRKR